MLAESQRDETYSHGAKSKPKPSSDSPKIMAWIFPDTLQRLPKPTIFTPQYKVTKIACGLSLAGMLTEQGKIFLWSFTQNQGQSCKSLLQTSPYFLAALENYCITEIACGDFHLASVDYHGQVLTLGCYHFGQLGTAPTPEMPLCGNWHDLCYCGRKIPSKEALSSIFALNLNSAAVKVSCGARSTTVLTTAGQVWGFGEHVAGYEGSQLSVYKSPQLIHLAKTESERWPLISDIQCGRSHTCAITSKGDLIAWGFLHPYDPEWSFPTKMRIPGKVAFCSAHVATAVYSHQRELYIWGCFGLRSPTRVKQLEQSFRLNQPFALKSMHVHERLIFQIDPLGKCRFFDLSLPEPCSPGKVTVSRYLEGYALEAVSCSQHLCLAIAARIQRKSPLKPGKTQSSSINDPFPTLPTFQPDVLDCTQPSMGAKSLEEDENVNWEDSKALRKRLQLVEGEMKSFLDQYKADLASVTAALEQEKDNRRKCESQLAQIQADGAAHTVDLRSLLPELSESALAYLTQKFGSLTGAYERQTTQLQTCESHLKEALANLEKCQSQYKDALDSNARLTSSKSQTAKALRDAEEQASNLNVQLQLVTASLSETQEKAESLASELALKENELRSVETQLAQRAALQQDQIAQDHKLLLEQSKRQALELGKAHRELEDVRTDLLEAQKEIETLKQFRSAMNLKLIEAEHCADANADQLELQKSEIERLERENKHYCEELQRVHDLLLKRNAEILNLTRELDSCGHEKQQEALALKKELEAKELKLEELRRSLTQTQTEAANIQKKLEASEIAFTKLLSDHGRLQQEWQTEKEVLTRQVKDFKNRSDELLDQFGTRLCKEQMHDTHQQLDRLSAERAHFQTDQRLKDLQSSYRQLLKHLLAQQNMSQDQKMPILNALKDDEALLHFNPAEICLTHIHMGSSSKHKTANSAVEPFVGIQAKVAAFRSEVRKAHAQQARSQGGKSAPKHDKPLLVLKCPDQKLFLPKAK